jgi:hypothetical protein
MANRQKLRQGIILFSFFLFPATFYYLSPVVILESASYGIVNGSFIVLVFCFYLPLYSVEDGVDGFVRLLVAKKLSSGHAIKKLA